MTTAIDLNADVGEGVGDGVGNDTRLIPLVTSASVAAGAHAGDDQTIELAVRTAAESGVAIGAHPGHADRDGFGRRPLPIDAASIGPLVVPQIKRVRSAAERHGALLRYVKLHGALYHQVAADAELAAAFLQAIDDLGNRLPVLGPGGTPLADVAAGRGHPFVAEGFADRRYLADGSLAPRSIAGAVLSASADIAAQAVALATDQATIADDGARVAVPCGSICLHGDRPDAVAVALAVRDALATAGVTVRAFADGTRSV